MAPISELSCNPKSIIRLFTLLAIYFIILTTAAASVYAQEPCQDAFQGGVYVGGELGSRGVPIYSNGNCETYTVPGPVPGGWVMNLVLDRWCNGDCDIDTVYPWTSCPTGEIGGLSGLWKLYDTWHTYCPASGGEGPSFQGHKIFVFTLLCDLKVTSFTGSNTTLDPTAGGSVTLTGSISDSSGQPISWTVAIAGQTYTGSGTGVSVTWDGKNVNGTAVALGTYTATLKAWHTSDPTCGVQKDIQITVVSSCNLGGLTISPSEVWPAGTEDGIFTQATIGLNLASPAPASGCEVRLRVEPVEGSGGHNHDGNRMAHTGAVEPNFAVFIPGESILNVVYNSGEVAGTERIIAEALDGNGSVTSTLSISVDVKVNGLSPLISTSNVLSCGGTDMHVAGNNNYGTSDTLNAVYAAVENYANKYHALYLAPDISLGVIDMSLPDGGLFDIYGNWQPPHELHREGKSVDFSHYYMDICKNPIVPLAVVFYNKDGSMYQTTSKIDTKLLDKMFAEQDCARKEKNIDKIHYECTK